FRPGSRSVIFSVSSSRIVCLPPYVNPTSFDRRASGGRAPLYIIFPRFVLTTWILVRRHPCVLAAPRIENVPFIASRGCRYRHGRSTRPGVLAPRTREDGPARPRGHGGAGPEPSGIGIPGGLGGTSGPDADVVRHARARRHPVRFRDRGAGGRGHGPRAEVGCRPEFGEWQVQRTG